MFPAILSTMASEAISKLVELEISNLNPNTCAILLSFNKDIDREFYVFVVLFCVEIRIVIHICARTESQ